MDYPSFLRQARQTLKDLPDNKAVFSLTVMLIALGNRKRQTKSTFVAGTLLNSLVFAEAMGIKPCKADDEWEDDILLRFEDTNGICRGRRTLNKTGLISIIPHVMNRKWRYSFSINQKAFCKAYDAEEQRQATIMEQSQIGEQS